MITEALLLASAWFWAPMPQGQALVCQSPQLTICLAQLPADARQQLPQDPNVLLQEMGHRGAMARPIRHQSITGVILLATDNIPRASSALLNGQVYSLTLQHAVQLTLLHELGHLAIASSHSIYLNNHRLSGYQHEWLADIYLLWSLAKNNQPNDLAWQQYHRRNLAVFASTSAMSHWTTPMLGQLMQIYSWQQLAEFEGFDALIDDLYPRLSQYDQDELNEFSSLIQRVFGSGVMHSLPHYMFWRRPEMGRYIRPTIETLMGKQAAESWLTQNAMNGE
ncbi:hypothetical protein [Shewanella psychrotolerans]|uniref:hypothetical protein n=1 Tax=Shewanella psychrotolerans TaxID=2864206 RepID=UPI001C66096F|nr:hypothetical protein [Shewanella psychrotolerans]QYK02007.1 hypothetical protein K0I62_03250 [Shewanella psychrotolerans]